MMSSMNKVLGRLSHTLLLGGALLMVFGFGGVAWSEALLILAMLAVALVATLFGLYEVWMALSVRRHSSQWWIVLLHGIASTLFGMLTVGVSGVRLETAIALAAAWLVFYAAIAWSAATLVWRTGRLRWALLGCGLLDFGLAIGAVTYPKANIFGLLYVGGWYAAAFGAWQLGAGVWLRRLARPSDMRKHESSFITVRS
jgi:uncharacterized membrane protein HdeD (DUF308 family)